MCRNRSHRGVACLLGCSANTTKKEAKRKKPAWRGLRRSVPGGAGAAPSPPADPAPANPAASTGRGTPAATASAPDKTSPRNEQNPAGANRTLVADLDSAVSFRGKNAAAAEPDPKPAATGNLDAGKRWTLSTPAPLPPPRPVLSGDIAVAFADA